MYLILRVVFTFGIFTQFDKIYPSINFQKFVFYIIILDTKIKGYLYEKLGRAKIQK